MKPDASAPLLPTAHAASEEKPPVQKRAKRRNALNLSRYLASCWIVAYHYYSGLLAGEASFDEFASYARAFSRTPLLPHVRIGGCI